MKGMMGAHALLPFLLSGIAAPQEPEHRVHHPNLLVNAQELEEIRAKIKREEWAAKLFDRVKQMADESGRTSRTPREAALVYAITGQKSYGSAVRKALVENARHETPHFEQVDLKIDPDYGAWGPWATWAWAYDLTYDLFSEEDRREVERMFRTIARTIIEGLKLRSTTPNLVFEKHWKVGLIGYCLGDRELIDWGLSDPGHHGPQLGGFYQVLDTMIKDGRFWGEAPIYALHYDIHGMLALAEAARHFDGTDLYRYVSKKNGASIKSLLDGFLDVAYPLERTGVEGGSIRMATFGDGSTSYGPKGELHDTYLINPISRTLGEPTLSGELEIAYARYHDPGYAWLLGLNPKRDAYIGSPGQGGNRPIWGFAALTHGQTLPEKLVPPPAPSAVYPSQGFAMLRSDEGASYWNSGALAALLRLGASVGHGHKDYFHLILHGKGRLLYPDLNVIQYEPTYLGWTHEGIAHNTLLVDRRSPRPGPFTTRQEFTPEAKFFAITGTAFEGIRQTRALLMTPDYLADLFAAADPKGEPHLFDWALHGLGELSMGNPAAYQPTESLLSHYWWIQRERGRTTDQTWRADWVQKSAGVTPGLQSLGKEWFEHPVGVRLTMLGAKNTEVYSGDGPLVDGPPHDRIEGNPEGTSPMIVARRRGASTLFAAIHEAYEKRPSITRVQRLAEQEGAVAIRVEGAAFSDRVLVALDGEKEEALASPTGETFAFKGYGHLRVAGNRLTIRGGVHSIRLLAPAVGEVLLNGEAIKFERDGDFILLGKPPGASSDQPAERPDPREEALSIRYGFLPEEAHLRSAGERELTLRLRAVGTGTPEGRLRLVAPKGLSVAPDAVDLAGLGEGSEKEIPLRLKASGDLAAGLYEVRVTTDPPGLAAPGSLPASVGVVMTEEKRLPRLAEFVVRAPGYTIGVDQYSGVSYRLLDGDGHRRHGRLHNTNFCTGIPGIEREGKWACRWGSPSRFVWEQKNGLVVGAETEGASARLRYTFQEDRIVLALTPPTNPTQVFTVWLGNFDALEKPQHNGTQRVPHEPIVADRFFFPHPVYRQGLFLSAPEKTSLTWRGTAVSLGLRAGQEVSLRFLTEEEAQELLKK